MKFLKIDQRLMKFSQSGKISPNLITLVAFEYDKNVRHSSVVSSAPTIPRPRVQTPRTPSTLFSVENEPVFVIGMRKRQK